MKCISGVLMIVFAFATAGAIETPEATIDYRNDFSDKSENLLLWMTEKAGIVISKNSQAGNKAPGALEFAFPSGNTKNASVAAGKFFTLKKNCRVTAIVRVKCEGFENSKTNIKLCFQGWTANKQQLPAAIVFTQTDAGSCRDWKQLTLTFTFNKTGNWKSADLLYLLLSVNSNGAGKVWFDDLEFFEDGEF